MSNYQCNVCKHIYSEEQGDVDRDVSPNTPFEELPDDWVCPLCGVEKSMFSKITDSK